MDAEVTIEPIALRHAEAVQRLASHPEVVAPTNLPDPYPEDGAREWIKALLPRQAAGDEYAFAILLRQGELVGVAGLVDVSPQEAELGYWIGKPYWNRGYATAAGRQVLDFAFEELGLKRVFARPLAGNRPSRQVLEKLGFSFTRLEAHEHPKWSASDRFARYEIRCEKWEEGAARLAVPEERQRSSWTHNASAWTQAVRNGQIESRKRGTDAAIVEAVEQYDLHRILDVGCGEGWLVRALEKKGYDVVGVDGSAPLIASARDGVGHFRHISYAEITADPHCLGKTFDAVVCNFSLLDKELVPLLEALQSRIRPGGYLLVQTAHPITVCDDDQFYRDGWKTETFDSFGEGFSASMPWYFRTVGSWVEVIRRSGYVLERCIEPRPEDAIRPLSLLLICSVGAV